MRKITKILFFFIAVIFGGLFSATELAFAEEAYLGSFNPQTFNEIFSQNISLRIKDFTYDLPADTLKKIILEKEDLMYAPGYQSEIENTDFCAYKKSWICNLLFSLEKNPHIRKISGVYLDENSLAQFLDELSKQTDKESQNATFKADDSGKISVFSLSSNGLALDKEKSAQIITDYFKNGGNSKIINLPYNEIKPEITTESIDNLGITSLIGEGVSNFAGSPKNRIFNLTLGAKKFNGVLIKPGDNFSFLKTLGPVDASTGYLPELVIKGDKTEPDYGGGMCQVSTTAFRAAIRSGLKITSRTPHAYPVQYYNPQGMDATVFIPSPDLRFTNNTPGYILIQTKIVGTQLFFDFYGTDDGRTINVIGPTITERNSDGSMKATFTQQVTDKNGSMFINQVFNSNYDSPSKYPHPGQVLTTKPKDWSKKQWEQYKKDNHL